MRAVVMTFLLLLSAALVAIVILSFPYLEFRRFTEPSSIDPSLTDRLLSIIDAHDEFGPGEFINDVSNEVCPWVSEEQLRALVGQPGWQFTAHEVTESWFKKTSFWPWDRHGLQIDLNSDHGCCAYVRRADSIGSGA